MMIVPAAKPQDRKRQPVYAPVTLCEISFHHERVNPKYISVDAEYMSAVPHGLFLTDRRCAKKVFQLDFSRNDPDPSVAFIHNHIFEIHRANGTFRGLLKRDRVTGALYLWLQSVVNFRSADILPEGPPGDPIDLPGPPLPKRPFSP
jgi:hypothetical protein